jgi:6-phosphogluconolactonase
MRLVFDNTAELISQAAQSLVMRIQEKPNSVVLLTGGTLGIELIAELGKLELDLSQATFLFGDERFVPLDHPDRNEHQGLEAFPGLQASLLRYPATGDLTEAAQQFSEVLQTRFGDLDGDQPVFDFAIVGMGPDGHIASLFPGHLQEKAWVIAEPNSPKPPAQRLSLSFQALARTNEVWFLVSGAAKADAVRCVFDGHCDLPAAKLTGVQKTIWFMDQELSRAL